MSIHLVERCVRERVNKPANKGRIGRVARSGPRLPVVDFAWIPLAGANDVAKAPKRISLDNVWAKLAKGPQARNVYTLCWHAV